MTFGTMHLDPYKILRFQRGGRSHTKISLYIDELGTRSFVPLMHCPLMPTLLHVLVKEKYGLFLLSAVNSQQSAISYRVTLKRAGGVFRHSHLRQPATTSCPVLIEPFALWRLAQDTYF